MAQWKLILRYGLVLMLGLVLGMTASRLVHKHRLTQFMQNRPAAQRQMMMQHLTIELQLTKPQQVEIERILNDQLRALSSLRERYQPEVQAIFKQAEEAMRPHLLPEQQQKLGEVMKRLQRHRSMHGRRPTPPKTAD